MFSPNVLISFSGLATGAISVLLYQYFMNRKKRIIISKNPEDATGSSFAYSGNLNQTSLLEAVQFLEIGNKSGILHIYCGRRKGYLTFLRGSVIDAFYRNHTGKEAVLQMFDIDEGDFYFENKKIFQPRIIQEGILDLAFEWDERKMENEINNNNQTERE